MLNECRFIGRLTKDPELKTTDGGAKYCSITLALNKKFKRRDGTVGDQTDFIRCTAWDSAAETISRYFLKGSWIIVLASAKSSRDQEGKERVDFRIDRFEFPQWTNNTRKKEDKDTSLNYQQAVAADVGDDEIPY